MAQISAPYYPILYMYIHICSYYRCDFVITFVVGKELLSGGECHHALCWSAVHDCLPALVSADSKATEISITPSTKVGRQ